MSEARTQDFDGLYQSLAIKEEEKSIYKFTEGCERNMRDLDQGKCIKDEEGRVLMHEKDIKDRWKKYFHTYLMKDMRS